MYRRFIAPLQLEKKWYDFGDVTDIEWIELSIEDSANSWTALYGVELDGEILVDGGSFGANGFHLPFNPDAAGANYSSCPQALVTSFCIIPYLCNVRR